MNNKIKIGYFSAYCGAGKTYGLSEYANRMALQGYKVLLVQPTTQLINETLRTTFPQVGVTARVTTINMQTHENCVKNSIVQYLKDADEKGEILLITHTAFFQLSTFHAPHNWIVIIDEIPLVERSFRHNIPDAHTLLTQYLVITDRSDTAYWKVGAAGSGMHLKKIASNPNRDEIWDCFSMFAGTVLSPHWHTYVLSENYRTLTNEEDIPGIQRQLIASALMKPSIFEGFRKVIVAGACFTESLMYLIWSLRGDVEFEPVKVAQSADDDGFKLQYTSHRNGHLLDIYYALDNHWSKNARDKIVTTKDGRKISIFDAITGTANAMIGAEPMVALVNNDKANALDTWENCERLPNVSHGLNTFQDRHHAILLSAINPHSFHFRFLKEFAGVEPQDVQTAMYRQTIYQAAARTSIRDQKNQNRKKWFVADSETASWLEGLFKGAKLHALNLFDPTEKLEPTNKGGRPRKHADGAAKVKASRERRVLRERAMEHREVRLEIVNGKANVKKLLIEKLWLDVETGMREPINLRHATIQPLHFMGSFFTSVEDNIGIPAEGSFDDLVDLYSEWVSMVYADKEAVPLWSPSYYIQRQDVDTSRGYDNIAYIRHIVLDNDGGDLSPKQFAALFPDWRMIVHSSWSSTEAKPKWRVIIETDAALDIEGYKAVTGHIMKRLNNRGFWTQKQIDAKRHLMKSAKGIHGFDVSKLNPACILFLPSQGGDPTQAYVRDVNDERSPMPVYTVLAKADLTQDEETAVRPPVEVLKPVYQPVMHTNPQMRAIAEKLMADKSAGFETSKARKVETALDRWNSEWDRPGQRDNGFWLLGVHLRNAGCDAREIADHLDDAARCSMSKEKGKLRSGIKRIINKLGV